MSQSDTAVVRKQVVVDASIERAFATFVERFGDFKPPEHNLIGSEIAESRFEPRRRSPLRCRGRRDRVPLGRVLAYEPPHRVVFSWDITPQWQLEPDEAKTSEVEVRFVAEAPERTRLELEHRHLDRHGPGWETLREATDSGGGWPLYLSRYVDLVESGR